MMRRLLYSSLPTTVSPHWINEDVESRLKFCGIRLPRSKDMGIYISGVLFATGWWAFIDAMIYSKVITGSQILTVKDWISGVLSTLGIVVVNSINKSCLTEIEYLHSNSCLSLWQARLTLFLGFVFMASGVCWSATNFVMNYILQQVPMQIWYFGMAMLMQNILIMLSTIVLWLSLNDYGSYRGNFRL